ncbi:cytosolic protein [Chloroflexota bacterium]
MVILTSYSSIEHPELLNNLCSKGIGKFIACEVSVKLAKERYREHFDVVRKFLQESDDLRVLDYSGQRAFSKFKFKELGNPIYQESE